MKARDSQTGTFKEVYVKALDSMPVGTIVDYDGQASDIPTGWQSYGTGQIKKTSETRPLTGTIVNAYNDSQVNAYSTEYINDKFDDTSVQIGDVRTELGGLIKTQTFSRTVNMPAGGKDYWQFSGITIPQGYRYLGILQNKCGDPIYWNTSWHCNGTNGSLIFAQVYNWGNQSTQEIQCTVLYVKNIS